MALQNLTGVPIRVLPLTWWCRGDILTLRVDAELHHKPCLVRFSFPKCYSNSSWWLIRGSKPSEFNFQTKGKRTRANGGKKKRQHRHRVEDGPLLSVHARLWPGFSEEGSVGWAGRGKPSIASCPMWLSHRGRFRISPTCCYPSVSLPYFSFLELRKIIS